MVGKVIMMAKAKFEYAVGLVLDDNADNLNPSYNNALSLLKDFLAANDGEYTGPFTQKGEIFDEYAIVKMTPAAERALHNLSVAFLFQANQKPFVQRIEGTAFNIFRAEGMIIHDDYLSNYPEYTA